MNNTLDSVKKYFNLGVDKENSDPQQALKYINKSIKYNLPELKKHKSDKGLIEYLSFAIVEKGVVYDNYKNGQLKKIKYYKAMLHDKCTKYINRWGICAIYNNIGVALKDEELGKKSLKFYKKAVSIKPSYSLPRSNLAYAYKFLGDNLNDESSKLKNHKLAIKWFNSLTYRDKANKVKYDINILDICLSIINTSDLNQKIWISKNVHEDINPLIFDSDHNKNNIDEFKDHDGLMILVNLFRIVFYSLKFLNNHLITESPKKPLYQYTGINTLKSICNVDRKFKIDSHKKIKFHLRLYNSDYMNDPLEGKELLKKFVNNKNNDNVKKLINAIYYSGNSNVNKKNKLHNLTVLHSSHVYMASLSNVAPDNDDSMPLWNSYSDDHKGIALGLGINVRKGLSSNKNDVYNMAISSNFNSLDKDKIPLNLYKISYNINDINNLNNSDLSHKLSLRKEYLSKQLERTDLDKYIMAKLQNRYDYVKSRINDMTNLKDLFIAMNKIPVQILYKDSHIFNLIKMSLDKIRFLSKTGAFRYEHEFRIMEEIPDSQSAKYDTGNEKLYVNLGSTHGDVAATLKQIVFGNRCKSYYWVPIVKKQLGSNVETLKSNIKYR